MDGRNVGAGSSAARKSSETRKPIVASVRWPWWVHVSKNRLKCARAAAPGRHAHLQVRRVVHVQACPVPKLAH
jgi:hypothetical protein